MPTKGGSNMDNRDENEGLRDDESSPRLIRRLLDTGLSVILPTGEEGEKGIKPIALSKELMNSIFNQVERGKGEMVTLFGREFKKFLEATDLAEVVVKALSQMTIEVKAEVAFRRNSDTEKDGKPKIKSKVTIKEDQEG